MLVVQRLRIAASLLVLGLGVGTLTTAVARAQKAPSPPAGPQQPPPPPAPEPQQPPPLEGPKTDAEALPMARPGGVENPAGDGEARRPTTAELPATTPAERVYVSKEPPPAIAERPSGDRPNPRAEWISGYWQWDPDSDRFVWVAGSWRVPPAGMVWVAGRWMHDADGWYWVPGVWRHRVNRPVIASNRPAWRTSGPPAEHPEDIAAPAPGPDYFYVPGHYAPAPDGDRLAWNAGFWARLQPGWEWLPARWVRRPDGWEFREGRWIRDPAGAVVVERIPPRALRRARRNAIANRNVTVTTRDPITGTEVDVTTPADPVDAEAFVGPPYYVIRPPGAYPYGPNGVVVPGTVPPFVRRMLDRVLP